MGHIMSTLGILALISGCSEKAEVEDYSNGKETEVKKSDDQGGKTQINDETYDDSSELLEADEEAVLPVNVTGAFLFCQESGKDKYGCNVMVDKKGRKKAIRVKLDLWADEIIWSYHSPEFTVEKEENTGYYHVEFSFEDDVDEITATNVKLELLDFKGTKTPSDYVISSPLGNLKGSSLVEKNSLLPEVLNIYVKGVGSFGTEPDPDASIVKLPTVNDYRATDGCYIACYTKDSENWVYAVSDEIGVMGMVRVQGYYEQGGSVCRPKGFETADISALASFKDLCDNNLNNCQDQSCWAGGDTRGFLYK
jgi:hypothetical protein